jgi:hypothetical protein
MASTFKGRLGDFIAAGDLFTESKFEGASVRRVGSDDELEELRMRLTTLDARTISGESASLSGYRYMRFGDENSESPVIALMVAIAARTFDRFGANGGRGSDGPT